MLTWTLAVAAAVCLAYYGIIVVYTGIGTASAAIWLLAGGFFAVSAAAVRIYQKYPDRMPMWIPVSMVTLCASGSLVVLTVLILIFGRIPAAAEPDLDYVIVLGASVKPEGVSRTLKLRLDKAAEYAKQNPSTMLILSGGQGADEPCTEASAMRQYLAEKGVSPERMILEEQSQSTTENIAYSRLLLKEKAENGKQEVGILTSNFHLLRARLIAAKQGMENIRGIAAESDKILFAHFCFRDSLAILKDRLMGNL